MSAFLKSIRRENLLRANLTEADLSDAVLTHASLKNAILKNTILRRADLTSTDIDFSCWPLWCGSLDAKVDRRIAAQLAYHFCRLDCSDPSYIAARNAIVDFANKFHLADDCGQLEKY